MSEWFSKTAAMPPLKRPTHGAKILAMKVEMLEAVHKGKLSRQTNISFSDFVDINNEVAVCSVLSDDKVINAALGSNEDDNDEESDVEEVPLRLTVTETSAALGTGGLLFLQRCWLYISFGAFEESSSIGTFHSVKTNKTDITFDMILDLFLIAVSVIRQIVLVP